MEKRSAPPGLTGGKGFNFEDHVAARFLLGLLGAAHPLGSDLGQLTRIDWQARDSGWRLDDLALNFGVGDEERSTGISIKSHKQVTESGFDGSFVRSCWEQWLGIGTQRKFRQDRDLLVLATGVLADGVRNAWDKIIREAIETAAASERFVARLQAPSTPNAGSQSSEIQRNLFQSLQCPDDLRAGGLTDEVAAARLLRHLRLVHLDFESVPSRAQEEAISQCRAALEAGTVEKAQELWKALVGIAARKRGRGGSIDLGELLTRLRGQFSLNNHPDYESDWNELQLRSQERLKAIGLTIANAARLPRISAMRRLLRDFRQDRIGVVVGESGVGKSALVRSLGERRRYRLVWLTADQLYSGWESTFERLLELRHLFAQVLEASPSRCLVVFDGIEGFSEPGLQLVAKLIASIRSISHNKPHIALTTQPDGLARLQAAFASARVPAEPWGLLKVHPPNESAVQRLLGRFPGLAWAALRPEFRSLLRNLKVFDWVVRLHESGGLAETPEVVTLTAIIDQLWAHFVEGGPNGLVRGALLKRVAAMEADQFVHGLPLSECDTGNLSIIPALESVGLVRRQDERIRFVHDMLADWARLKQLVEQRLTESEAAIHHAAAAGWYRSVRLYAQRILEQPGDGLEHWHREVQALGSGNKDRVIIRDLFLEALVLAQDSRILLSSAWPTLVTGNGELLKLLLDRFAYVGTVPDWGLLSGINDPAAAAQVEHLFRIPFEPYWYGVLPVLAEHPNDVIRCALAPTAKLLRLWLSTVRPRRGPTSELRRTAARLTLTIAREIQALEAEHSRSVEQEVRTDVYVALLWASPEFSTEVAQICLELANRRPEAESVRLRLEVAQEKNRRATERLLESRPEVADLTRQLITPEQLFGPKPAPWPDGPKHRVDEAFQKACLDRQAIMPFVVNRPQEALETFLAILIQHATHQDWDANLLFGNSMGLDDNRQCHPPFYYQGPFWCLLRSSSETAEFALTLIIRVVNFATERWQECYRRLTAKYPDVAAEGPSCVTVPIGESWKEFPGDRNVLCWNDGSATQPDVLSSMLMAVEKWLYDEIDAGHSIDRWVGRIFSEGKSAALIGVLVLLAKYKPGLLTGPLRPLVGACEIYSMEFRLRLERSSMAFWSMHWMPFGESAWNKARDWYGMPHRKALLADQVMPLVLQGGAVQTDMLAFYQQWEKRLEAEPNNAGLRGAVSSFGVVVRYLKAVSGGGEKLPDFHKWLQQQQQEAAAAQEKANENLLPLILAPRCRKHLDEDRPLATDELIPFWNGLQRFASQPRPPTEGGTQIVDAVFGGIAVLLLLHRDWVREDPARERWCRDQLEGILRHLPSRRPLDFPESAGGWNWDTFASECGVALLAENREDPLARELVLDGLVCFRYATVVAIIRRAYRLRAKFGSEFEQMLTLVAEWSMYRWALQWSEQWGLDSNELRVKCAQRLDTFLTAEELPPRPDLARIDAEGRRLIASIFDAYRNQLAPKYPESTTELDEDDGAVDADDDYPTLYHGIPPTWPGLDLQHLRSGFAWLEIAVVEEPFPELAIWALRGLLDVSLRTVPPSDAKRRDLSTRFPTKFDEWLYERIAGALLGLDRQGQADDFWRSILSLGVRREHWLKYFLSDWFRVAAGKEVKPEEFVALWKRMIQYALDAPGWDSSEGSWSHADDVVNQLLGFEMGKAVFGDDKRYEQPIAGISHVFENAANRWFVFSTVAAGFCRFVQKPAGSKLLFQGIRWLAAAEPNWSKWSWEHERLAEDLVDALRLALERHRGAIAADAESRGAFFHLCNQLVARGHHAALALRERVAKAPGE
jgi:hypothetical protein